MDLGDSESLLSPSSIRTSAFSDFNGESMNDQLIDDSERWEGVGNDASENLRDNSQRTDSNANLNGNMYF